MRQGSTFLSVPDPFHWTWCPSSIPAAAYETISFFYGWITFCCKYTLYCLQPFFHEWAPRLISNLGCKHVSTSVSSTSVPLVARLLDHTAVLILRFILCCVVFLKTIHPVSTVNVLIYTPNTCMRALYSPYPSILESHWGLVWTSLVTSGTEQFKSILKQEVS